MSMMVSEVCTSIKLDKKIQFREISNVWHVGLIDTKFMTKKN